MKQYLQKYQVVIKTVGPVFIGSGREIGKKEYVFLDKHKIGITDIQALYQKLVKKGKGEAFERYLLSRDRMNLTDWLKSQNVFDKELDESIKYKLDCGDALLQRNVGIQVLECVKDAYGNPYIPGSSLKGMFRTILLCEDIISNPQKYKEKKEAIRRTVMPNRTERKVYRTTFLRKEIGDVEAIAYRTLKRGEKKDEKSAINDIMQGFIVSDSEPLSVDDLVLCQPVEVHTDGKEKRLPILRECIKPDTEIRFTLTIDHSICKMSGKSVADAVKMVIENYYRCFQKAFSGIPAPTTTSLFLGGGSGFVSKTMIYAMFQKQDGLEITSNIFDKTGVPRIHKHNKDKMYGASPHTLKCTYYQKQLLQMGLCRLRKIVI